MFATHRIAEIIDVLSFIAPSFYQRIPPGKRGQFGVLSVVTILFFR